jgi:hypothetical protein
MPFLLSRFDGNGVAAVVVKRKMRKREKGRKNIPMEDLTVDLITTWDESNDGKVSFFCRTKVGTR